MSDELLDELRPAAFGVAYRMLGSVAEAEDVVQEALLRVHRELEGGAQIASPRAFVSTVAARLALDQLRSARVRRERYVGDWLPEPLVTDANDPARVTETADDLSLAFLVVLESLSPEQRAALLLHDVFDYGYDEVASVVGTSEANARQLASRARRHVAERRPRFETSREQRDRLAARFFDAFEEGNLEALEAMLADDVTPRGDGGGKAPALARALHGRVRVARTLRNFSRAAPRFGLAEVRRVEINGDAGALAINAEGELITAISLEIAGGQIRAVNSVVNPDKLRHLGPVGDLAAQAGEATRG